MFAPYTNDRRAPDQGRVLGYFRNAETDAHFEYADRGEAHYWPEARADEWPHIIFTGDGTRCARVLKTRAYIAVDEDEFGRPIAERWDVKQHRQYDQ
jgi:hypothetical protein